MSTVEHSASPPAPCGQLWKRCRPGIAFDVDCYSHDQDPRANSSGSPTRLLAARNPGTTAPASPVQDHHRIFVSALGQPWGEVSYEDV